MRVVQVGQGVEDLAVLRHPAMYLFQQETAVKIGVHVRRMRCGREHCYLRRVLSVFAVALPDAASGVEALPPMG